MQAKISFVPNIDLTAQVIFRPDMTKQVIAHVDKISQAKKDCLLSMVLCHSPGPIENLNPLQNLEGCL